MSTARGFVPHVGISSIVVVFVLLCLSVFSALSLVSANADYRLTRKSAEAAQLYYLADSEAEATLQLLSETLLVCRENSASTSEYFDRAASALRELGAETELASETDLHVRYCVPVTETQILEVELQVEPALDSGSCYGIVRWQMVATDTGLILEDEPMPVWPG